MNPALVWAEDGTLCVHHREWERAGISTGVRLEFTRGFDERRTADPAGVAVNVGDTLEWTVTFRDNQAAALAAELLHRAVVCFADGREVVYDNHSPGLNHGLLLWDSRWADCCDDRRRLARAT